MNNPALTRVLVIDDDAAMTEMLRLILEPNAFEVKVSHSGREAIESARHVSPEVIILDLSLDDMDGGEVCKEIRSFSQAPILVLSAISRPGMVAKALDEGADDFLLKPMTSSVLIAHLKRLVWRARAEEKANHRPDKGNQKAQPSTGSVVHRNSEPRKGKDIRALQATKYPTQPKDDFTLAPCKARRRITQKKPKKSGWHI